MEKEKPYRLPDPEKNPEQTLVLLYKALKRVPYNDRGWDKLYFGRCMKRTQELLENLGGDVKLAARCMVDLKERFEADGTKWTIETLVAYCFEWRSEFLKVSDRDCLRDLSGAYAMTPAGAWIKAAIRPEAPAPAPRLPEPELTDEERQQAGKVLRACRETLQSGAKPIQAKVV